MPAQSLVRLATDACIASIRRIYDVGDCPYHILRPVLIKVENPQQLREIEEASPQICGADAEIWRLFIKRDIPNWQSKSYEPKNPQNWWKVYRKLRREAEEEIHIQGAALKATMDEKQLEKDKHQMTFLHGIVAHPQNNSNRRTGIGASRQFSVTSKNGPRTKMATGKSVMDKVRREAREARLFSARNSVLATPLQRLNNRDLQSRNVSENLGHTGREQSRPSTARVNRTSDRQDDAPISKVVPANGNVRVPSRADQNLASAPHEKPNCSSSVVPSFAEPVKTAMQSQPIGKKRTAVQILMPIKRSRI